MSSMGGRARQAAWQPTPRELLLLAAATLERERALPAWRAWRAGVEERDGEGRLLWPLVWRNLGHDLHGDPMEELLRAEYARTWTQNQILHHRAGGVLGVLHNAGIETLVLKGTALATRYYGDLGVRPMGDVDILVRPEHRARATAILAREGWSPLHPDFERHAGARHAENFADRTGGEIDLHWQALALPGGDDETWGAALPTDVAHQRTKVPGPADQLLHVCVHGALLERVAGARWIADALTVIRYGVDWDRLVEQAIERRLTVVASAALGLLAREFPESVPAHALQALAVAPAGLVERAAHGRPLVAPSLPRRLLLDVDRYCRARRLGNDEAGGVSFLAYVRHSHQADDWPALVRRRMRDARTRMLVSPAGMRRRVRDRRQRLPPGHG